MLHKNREPETITNLIIESVQRGGGTSRHGSYNDSRGGNDVWTGPEPSTLYIWCIGYYYNVMFKWKEENPNKMYLKKKLDINSCIPTVRVNY